MQKQFDTDNEEDMKLLWSILPDEAEKARKVKTGIEFLDKDNEPCLYIHDEDGGVSIIKINWHDATEITRPVYYEDMIGCVCKFSTCPIRIGGCFIGVLDNIDKDSPCKFHVKGGGWFEYCEPVKKSELKFWGD